MQFLELTLPTPEENLALDEALLERVEAGEQDELLRVWEAPRTMVVIGRSSKIAEEVRLDYCRRHGIAVLRRCSGGAAVVAGPGCLMYAVILRHDRRPNLRMINRAHEYVMSRVAQAARRFSADVTVAGISDLAVGPQQRKFSGNSLRCKRDSFLYHGTILYDFPLELIVNCLDFAPRQPQYRAGRSHDEFVANLSADPLELTRALKEVWQVEGQVESLPEAMVRQLVEQQYTQAHWNLAR
ncbi:MAG: lipoate--protein ligase family protein [Planctomycetales bacterium]|nr:lipoate--protein ligase family protein [Planctomycetales bacterium]